MFRREDPTSHEMEDVNNPTEQLIYSTNRQPILILSLQELPSTRAVQGVNL
jgi:hypothetical protein